MSYSENELRSSLTLAVPIILNRHFHSMNMKKILNPPGLSRRIMNC